MEGGAALGLGCGGAIWVGPETPCSLPSPRWRLSRWPGPLRSKAVHLTSCGMQPRAQGHRQGGRPAASRSSRRQGTPQGPELGLQGGPVEAAVVGGDLRSGHHAQPPSLN